MAETKSQTLKTIFGLIRFPNLFIIGLSMVLVQFTLIKPILEMNGLQGSINYLVFFLLLLSTVLIAAGGYVVNDILDVKIDLINKPEKVLVGKKYPLQSCWDLYWTLTIAGVIAGLLAAWYNKTNTLMSIAPLEAGLLWFYSSILKRKFLVGNLVVSFLCALALFKPFLFNAVTYNAEGIAFLVIGYAGFAFIITLIREIIKDLEDQPGDEAYDCKTVPIVIGAISTKIFIALLVVVVMAALGWFQYNQLLSETFYEADYISFGYILLFIQLPLINLLFLVFKATASQQFHRTATLTKIIMLTGICSMLVFYYLL